jgi:hypothetical protein
MNKPMIFCEPLAFSKNTLAPAREQAQLMLNAKDEAERLAIIENDEYSSWDSLKQCLQST